MRAVQYYPVVRAFFERKRRGKPEAIARAIVAKEIARIAYHVFRKEKTLTAGSGERHKPPEETELAAPASLRNERCREASSTA